MTRTRKLFCIFAIVLVTFISLTVPCLAANSVITSQGIVETKAMFLPSSIIWKVNYGTPYYYTVQPTQYYGVASQNNVSADYGYTNSGNSAVAYNQRVYNVSDRTTGYGLEYYPGTFYAETYLQGAHNQSYDLTMTFEDIFIPPNLVSYDWSKLGTVILGNGDLPIESSSFSISVTYRTLSTTSSSTNCNYYQNVNVSFTGDAYNSNDWLSAIKTRIMNGTPYSTYKNGILIDRITIKYSGIDTNSVDISGNIRLGNPYNMGASRAIDQWDQYFTVTSSSNSNTLLGSVSKGVNSIMETKIFGTWTIGQVFGACVGLALFTWFLKLFAGG